jgi:hypothetical protein
VTTIPAWSLSTVVKCTKFAYLLDYIFKYCTQVYTEPEYVQSSWQAMGSQRTVVFLKCVTTRDRLQVELSKDPR